MANKPNATFKGGGVQVARWGFADKASFGVSKRYKDRDGNWKDTTMFFKNEIPLLIALLWQAFNAPDGASVEWQPSDDVPV